MVHGTQMRNMILFIICPKQITYYFALMINCCYFDSKEVIHIISFEPIVERLTSIFCDPCVKSVMFLLNFGSRMILL